MSASNNYNPVPPRVWSRVQNGCTYVVPGSSYNTSYVPINNETVSQAQADYLAQLYYKGNVLQYKGNSSRLTKKQRYTQLAKGFGPNRTKVFATQSQTYTNPNTTGLVRTNYVTYPFPNQIVGAPNNIAGPFEYNVPNPVGCPTTSLEDGGTLVCGTFANPCTGEVLKASTNNANVCAPMSASDVPGNGFLCWNKKIQTWFPKPRYVMNNSTDKWPQGYKGFQSAVTLIAPVLVLTTNVCGPFATLNFTWTVDNTVCVPISSFHIYRNGTFFNAVSYQITSFTVTVPVDVTYSFYVTSVSYSMESPPSNTVTFTGVATFTATGNYTLYNNNCLTALVFEYASVPQSLTLLTPQVVTLIVVGGGGGGTYGNYVSGGLSSNYTVGGGGGGTTYIQNLYLTAGTYTITVGSGGQGGTAISAIGQNGSNSTFGPYISYGGSGGGQTNIYFSSGGGCNTVYGGGGGMGGTQISGISTTTLPPQNNISGVNSISGNQGSILFTNQPSLAGSSFYAYNSTPIFVPFIDLNSTITVGGGGGFGATAYGGGSGQGQGGASGVSSTINGQNASNSITTGYGGGGGAGGDLSFPSLQYGNGGNGGNGAVIVYWPPYNSSYLNTDNFVGNFTIYQNNGYIGYVFSYGSGTITFNEPVNNVNMILCGGGGAGCDGTNNNGVNIGGGGGGGGSVYSQGLSFSLGQTFSVSVGAGGTFTQPAGANTVFGAFTAQGGGGSPVALCNGGNGGSGSGNGGGGGGGGAGVTMAGNAVAGTGGGVNPGSPGQSIGGPSNGGNSWLYNNYGGITMPFLPSPTTVQFGGGGQSGDSDPSLFSYGYGGGSGLGAGGSAITSQFIFGGNGVSNINSGFGGGGGGYNYNPVYGGGGSGGNGVVILWWQV